MLGFLRIFCLVGLPIFAIAFCSIWKPVRDPVPAKSVALTIVALMASVFLGMLLLFPLAAWLIWKPTARPESAMDRVAWTVFALGICLMLTMALFALTQEGDGDWRSWDRIRLHTRVFLALCMIPVAGPLVVYWIQATRKRPPTFPDKKPQPIDDWDEAAGA